jgi:hypothetical protein
MHLPGTHSSAARADADRAERVMLTAKAQIVKLRIVVSSG